MRVQTAGYRDVRAWLDLAAEVEPLFGDMLGDSRFYLALLRNIERGTAFCVREDDRSAGAALMGGMLFSPRRPERDEYQIGWLAVASNWRRLSVGRRLVEHAFSLVEPPAVLTVDTFTEDVPQGGPARLLYERMGFSPTGNRVHDGSREVYRRAFVADPFTGGPPGVGRSM